MWLGSINDIEGPSIYTMGPRERTFDEVLQLVSPGVGHDSKAQCDTAFIGKLTPWPDNVILRNKCRYFEKMLCEF